MFIGGLAVPKVAYSEEDRAYVRETLITAGLKLVAEQGVQHTTVEQICKAAGISRTFFYSFFPAKEDLVVEALYFQQPNLLAFARSLMEDPSLSWREGVERFLCACCYGEKNGIAVLTDRRAAAHLPTALPGELPDVPQPSGTAVRKPSRVLRHPSEPRAHRVVHEHLPRAHRHPPRHSGHAPAVCPGGRRRSGAVPDPRDHGRTGIPAGIMKPGRAAPAVRPFFTGKINTNS